ncbi:MAG: hypothetical protein O3A00_02955 [Planctomycetota bacterium]|nr:hypothetical protein [Planctomycetota bacterium]
MLALPNHFQRSVRAHQTPFDLFCDWIEGSALFDQPEIAVSDVADVLIEEQIYDEDNWDFCTSFIHRGFAELRKRQQWLGKGASLRVDSNRIKRRSEWPDVPGHSFCLLVAIAGSFEEFHRTFGPDFTEQGSLFEELTIAAVEQAFSGWRVFPTGWSRNRAIRLTDAVPKLAAEVGEEFGEVSKWAGTQANEAGLDVVWHKPFPDDRGGRPVYLAQCASGADWPKKLSTPELSVWNKLITWTHPPSKAFAMPFALGDADFVRRSNQVSGLLLDRYRLLSPSVSTPDWVPADLKDRITDWVEPRLEWIRGLNA